EEIDLLNAVKYAQARLEAGERALKVEMPEGGYILKSIEASWPVDSSRNRICYESEFSSRPQVYDFRSGATRSTEWDLIVLAEKDGTGTPQEQNDWCSLASHYAPNLETNDLRAILAKIKSQNPEEFNSPCFQVMPHQRRSLKASVNSMLKWLNVISLPWDLDKGDGLQRALSNRLNYIHTPSAKSPERLASRQSSPRGLKG
ncbi:hypothetical protein EBZ37_13795, partial [bacterium]|nr:hypothetical protein [bacterium]